MNRVFVPSETWAHFRQRGQKQVRNVIPWERGNNVIAISTVAASGNHIPPVLISPRKRMYPQFQKNGPVRALYSCFKMSVNLIFLFEWLLQFIVCQTFEG
jgi:hypothetical protein